VELDTTRIKQWWPVLAIVLAIVALIGWKEKRCQSAACDSSGYFCHFFSAVNLPTLLLVIVGFGGIRVAIRTLKAIERQAEAIEIQGEALINSERAWVDGEITNIDAEIAGAARYELQIINHGKTPAEIFSWHMNSGYLTEGTEFSPERLDQSSMQNLHVFIGGGKSHTLRTFKLIDLFGDGGGTDAGAICVTIKYADVVTDPKSVRRIRETYFVYHSKPIVESLYRISQYNRYT
jgi:hypothetical protein